MGVGWLAWIVVLGALGGPQSPPPERSIEAPRAVASERVDADAERQALVIGNGAYRNVAPLAQAPDDARLLARTFEGLGFRTELVIDADLAAMKRAIEAFEQALPSARVGVFYYAGHAVQLGGVNYLVPIDGELTDPHTASTETIDAGRVVRALETTHTPISIVVLDACRTNPFAAAWTGNHASRARTGLAQLATQGQLVAYATNPGEAALDSGIYARALADRLTRPCQSIMDAFYQVRDDVVVASEGHQVPWIGGSPGTGFSRFQPAGCGSPPSVRAAAVRAPRNAVEALETRLARARELYQQRCVVELGRASTATERKSCHERYHPKVQAAQDALDDALLAADDAERASRPRPE